MRALTFFATLLACSASAAPPGSVQVRPETLQWNAASPAMPPGTQIAVLEGSPKSEGWFTIRLKVPANSRIAPHWHPRDERVTVLSGTVIVGFGDNIEESALAKFGAGSFYVNPANVHHYVLFPDESVVQITGVGPWEVHFLDARDAAPAR